MAINLKQSAQTAARRIANIFSRGTIQRVTDTTGTQTVQVSLYADESRDNIEHPQEYGYTSRAPVGAEAIAAFFNGGRDHGVVITVFDKRYRIKSLQAGEVCIYDDLGTKILLKRGNQIEITAATSVKLITPLVRITGNLEVEGEITDLVGTNSRKMSGMRSVYNSHTHPETGTTTNTPNQSM